MPLPGGYTKGNHQTDRMLPIVLGLIPTLVGSGMLVGLKSTPEHKGALLFGKRQIYIPYGHKVSPFSLSLLYSRILW